MPVYKRKSVFATPRHAHPSLVTIVGDESQTPSTLSDSRRRQMRWSWKSSHPSRPRSSLQPTYAVPPVRAFCRFTEQSRAFFRREKGETGTSRTLGTSKWPMGWKVQLPFCKSDLGLGLGYEVALPGLFISPHQPEAQARRSKALTSLALRVCMERFVK